MIAMKKTANNQQIALRISAGCELWALAVQNIVFIKAKFDDFFVQRSTPNAQAFSHCIHSAFVRRQSFGNEVAFKGVSGISSKSF